jgi:TonB family protein
MMKITTFRLGSLLALPFAMTLASGPARAGSPADVAAELARARALQVQGKSKAACKTYQHASELAHGQSAPSWIGLSGCFTQLKEGDKAVAAARQALAVAATPEERNESAMTLGWDLLHLPGEPARTEALALFKQQAADPATPGAQWGMFAALLFLHRDQEVTEGVQALRQQGKSEEEIEQSLGGFYPGPPDDAKQQADFNERLHRLAPDVPLQVGGNVTRPEIRTHIRPEITAESRRHGGFSGTVILESVIDAEGKVTRVRVLKGQPMGLSESAVAAVKQWTFSPATLDGKPVKAFYVLTVNFQIP